MSTRKNWSGSDRSRVLESAPPPTKGEMGEFRADCRRSLRILARFRALKARVVRERQAGTWSPTGTPIRAVRYRKGPPPPGWNAEVPS